MHKKTIASLALLILMGTSLPSQASPEQYITGNSDASLLASEVNSAKLFFDFTPYYQSYYENCLKEFKKSGDSSFAKESAHNWTMDSLPSVMQYSSDGKSWSKEIARQDVYFAMRSLPAGKHTYMVRFLYNTGRGTNYRYATVAPTLTANEATFIYVSQQKVQSWPETKNVTFKLSPQLLRAYPKLTSGKGKGNIYGDQYPIDKSGKFTATLYFEPKQTFSLMCQMGGKDLNFSIPNFEITPKTEVISLEEKHLTNR